MFPWWISWQLRWWTSTLCTLTILLSLEKSRSSANLDYIDWEGHPEGFLTFLDDDDAYVEAAYPKSETDYVVKPDEGKFDGYERPVSHLRGRQISRSGNIYRKNKINNKYQEVYPSSLVDDSTSNKNFYFYERNPNLSGENNDEKVVFPGSIPNTFLNDEPTYHYGQSFPYQQEYLPSQNIIFPFKFPRDIASLEVPSGNNGVDSENTNLFESSNNHRETSSEKEHFSETFYTGESPPQVVSEVMTPNTRTGMGGLHGMGGSAVHPIGPIIQQFATEPVPQTAVVGSTAVIPCRVMGKVGHLQWTKDGFGMGTDRNLFGFQRYSMIGDDDEGDFSLRIQPVQLDDDALFQCQVSAIDGIPGIRSRPAHLTVYVPPDPPLVTPKVLKTTAGAAEILKCESRGGRPAPEIQWVDDSRRESIQMGSLVTSNLMEDGKRSIVKSQLSFIAQRYHDNQTITCLTSNQALSSPLTSSILLEVMFPPEVDLMSKPKTLIEGDDVTFVCEAISNPSKVTYRWFLNERQIQKKTSSTLSLENISRNLHRNRISCEVSNRVGTSKKTHNVMVHYGPTFRSMPRDVMAEEGKEAVLKCNVDANPSPSVVWLKMGSSKIIGSGSSLHIQVNTSSAGVYKCVASVRGKDFDFPELTGHVRLLLKGPPQIVSESEQQGRLGDTVNIICSTVSVPSPIKVTWTYRGREIDLNNPRYEVVEDGSKERLRNILVIHDSHSSDFGSYNCSVVNEYGVAKKLITLHPEKRIPILVVVGCGAAVIVVAVIVAALVFCNKQHTAKETSHSQKPFSKPPNDVDSKSLYSVETGRLMDETMPLHLTESGMQLSPLHNSNLAYSAERRKSYQDVNAADSSMHHSHSDDNDPKLHEYEQQFKEDEAYCRYKSRSQQNISYSSGEFTQRTGTYTSLLTPSPHKYASSSEPEYCTMRRGSHSYGMKRSQHLSPQHNGYLVTSSLPKPPVIPNGATTYSSPKRSFNDPPSGSWSPHPPPYSRRSSTPLANGRVGSISEDTRTRTSRHGNSISRPSEPKVMFAPGSKLVSGASFI